MIKYFRVSSKFRRDESLSTLLEAVQGDTEDKIMRIKMCCFDSSFNLMSKRSKKNFKPCTHP